MNIQPTRQQSFDCPYCNARLETGVLSCRHCSRDLTSVLPLLSRISQLEDAVAALQGDMDLLRREGGASRLLPPTESRHDTEFVMPGRRRFWPLPLGFAALICAYAMVVLWLDLPLSVLRFSSIAAPLVTGFLYLGRRPRLTWIDVTVALVFALVSVFTMNLVLAWSDSIPVLPQGTAAWRETMYYVLSIGASMFSGMLSRMLLVAMSTRGFTSLPRLRQGLLSVNKNIPLDTLKAVELAVLLLGTLLSAVMGLFAGIMGLAG